MHEWKGRSGERPRNLVLLFPSFLPAPLSRERFFNALLFAGFQIEGVPLNLLDDVLLLHFPFESAQRILEGLALLKSDFRQETTPPSWSGVDLIVITRF